MFSTGSRGQPSSQFPLIRSPDCPQPPLSYTDKSLGFWSTSHQFYRQFAPPVPQTIAQSVPQTIYTQNKIKQKTWQPQRPRNSPRKSSRPSCLNMLAEEILRDHTPTTCRCWGEKPFLICDCFMRFSQVNVFSRNNPS